MTTTAASSRVSRFGIRTIAMTSGAVGLAVLGLKLLAWYVTGSVALFSDALESIVNVAASTAALIAAGALYVGTRPSRPTAERPPQRLTPP